MVKNIREFLADFRDSDSAINLVCVKLRALRINLEQALNAGEETKYDLETNWLYEIHATVSTLKKPTLLFDIDEETHDYETIIKFINWMLNEHENNS